MWSAQTAKNTAKPCASLQWLHRVFSWALPPCPVRCGMSSTVQPGFAVRRFFHHCTPAAKPRSRHCAHRTASKTGSLGPAAPGLLRHWGATSTCHRPPERSQALSEPLGCTPPLRTDSALFTAFQPGTPSMARRHAPGSGIDRVTAATPVQAHAGH